MHAHVGYAMRTLAYISDHFVRPAELEYVRWNIILRHLCSWAKNTVNAMY